MRLSLEWLAVVAIAVADLTLLGACSPAPAPVASSPHDPSNPAAPEGVDLVGALSVAPNASPTAHAAADAGPVVYACPMHPEVTSEHASKCPKCGMSLAPKK